MKSLSAEDLEFGGWDDEGYSEDRHQPRHQLPSAYQAVRRKQLAEQPQFGLSAQWAADGGDYWQGRVEHHVNRKRVMLRTCGELGQLPTVTYLDERHELVRGGLNVLYARRGVGKSFVALDYALRLARTDPVIYVAGEGVGGYPDRVAAWLSYNQTQADHFRFIEHAIAVLRPDELSALIEAAAPLKPSLIVLDTLARCMASGDENNTMDMSRFVQACDRLRQETGTALLVVHHTGKIENGTRGSIVLEDAADMVISLGSDQGAIRLSCAKAKDSAEFEPRYLRLLVTPAREGQQSCVLVPTDRVAQAPQDRLKPSQRKLLQALASEEFREAGAMLGELCEVADLPQTSASRVLGELVQQGHVEHEKPGAPYSLTELGLQLVTED